MGKGCDRLEAFPLPWFHVWRNWEYIEEGLTNGGNEINIKL